MQGTILIFHESSPFIQTQGHDLDTEATPYSILHTPHSALHTAHSLLNPPQGTIHTAYSSLHTPHQRIRGAVLKVQHVAMKQADEQIQLMNWSMCISHHRWAGTRPLLGCCMSELYSELDGDKDMKEIKLVPAPG